MMKKCMLIIISILFFSNLSYSQTITQTVIGIVFDKTTQEPIIGASVVLLDSEPLVGTSTDIEGKFKLQKVPVGRRGFEVRAIGYKSYFVDNILINSGKQMILKVELIENYTELNEVVIKAKKDVPLNSMATLSSRQFTVEETQRYAGGLNDPARLVSSFAGVTTPSISSNGISVRGNSPSGLMWRIEGVEVPSPNHFANLSIAGAGLLTVLSSQMMGNSDFYTGAFPAEYGNANSGVFDIKLRSGNTSNREYTIQAGVIGLDFATEGPFVKGKDASYLVNYRYSTMALISPLLPSNSGILKYQDLSFKINIPTKKTGNFSIWSIAALDGIDIVAPDSSDWKSITDRDNSQTSLFLFASGLKHKKQINSKTFLNTAFTVFGNGTNFKEQRLDNNLNELPQSEVNKNEYRFIFQSNITHYFNKQHTNKTGFYFSRMSYNLNIKKSIIEGYQPISLVEEKGKSELFQFFSQSKLDLNSKFTLNMGIHAQYFNLNKDYSIEPRLALKYQMNKKNNIALAYGLHSKIESLPIYFVNIDGEQPNKKLKLMKSHHFVLAFKSMLTKNLKLSIEPYYQSLNNIPVSPTSYLSTINTKNSLFFDELMISKGKGHNVGIDFTLEQYINKGFYYMITASIFDSKYRSNDGVERNTRFNKNYVFNALIGKEWIVGKSKNDLLSLNLRLNYLGGNRKESYDNNRSINNKEVVYAETGSNLSFAEKLPDIPIVSFTFSYRRNKPKYSSIWSLQVLNVTQTEEFETDYYDINSKKIESKFNKIMIPNLSYKIEF